MWVVDVPLGVVDLQGLRGRFDVARSVRRRLIGALGIFAALIGSGALESCFICLADGHEGAVGNTPFGVVLVGLPRGIPKNAVLIGSTKIPRGGKTFLVPR